MSTEAVFICAHCQELSAIRWIGFRAVRGDGPAFQLCWKCAESLDHAEIFAAMKKFREQSTLAGRPKILEDR